jgi:hypothetical protein
MAFQGQRSCEEGSTPLGKALPGSSVERPPLLRCKPLYSISTPCWGLSIHLVGSSSPWRSKLIISPCVPVQCGTCPLGMILHINSDALHGLISHRDHSNVNHISSSILLNMCIKPLYPSQWLKDIIQVCNTSLGKVTGHPIGLVSTGKRKFPEDITSKSCKWVRWIRDVLTRVQ